MTLQEDLKAKALSLISQQMANWVVDIQRQIGEHQGNLVRALDDLQEQVARYDEKINEGDIEMAMAEVVANMPPPEPAAPVGPGFDQLKASVAALERGTSLSEVLTHLVNEVSQYIDRAAMFIVKGPSAIGWYGRGLEPADVIKQVNVPLNADTVLRNVNNSRHAMRGALEHSPGTQQALARLGGNPQAVLAVPLILRDKLAAILYCDTTQEEVPGAVADLIEVLVLFAGKTIDMLSLAPKTAAAAPAAAPAPSRPPAPVARPAAAAAPAPADEGGSTVMFNAQQMSSMRPQGAAASRPAAAPHPPPAAAPSMSPEETKAHEDAKRFARLVVSEIKLYNEAKVNEGRRHKDIYERLKEDIERGRQMYADRVAPHV
ncbi:MAG TPA: hypothetical protein VIK51_06630, partial [Vicinamibacteria bacterium]